ncbi:MAG: aryl-sulfate sulfotransferase [Lautropia sp.]
MTLDQTTIRRRGAGLVGVDEHRTEGGCTLIAPLTAEGRVYLIDIRGEVVHQWQAATRPGRHAVLLPNGNLGYNGVHPDSPDLYAAWPLWHGGLFQEITPSGTVVWEHADPAHHHDARWLANGNLLYTTAEALPPDIAARITGGSAKRDPADGRLFGDVVKEVDRRGRTVWTWRAWEHLSPEAYPILPFFDRFHWPMINGVNLTRDGLVLMSLRTTSGLIAVDRASGRTAWQVGPDVLSGQHTPEEVDDGRILVFDNGNFRHGSSTPFSRVVELDPATRAVAWEYADPVRPAFFSAFMGGAQRLAGGNTLITESATGRLFEVTPSLEVVWEYVIPWFAEYTGAAARCATGETNSVFRTHRYPREQIAWL